MLFSKNLRTALGTASLLMSLVVADSSFAAAAPKAVVKKAQPTYNFSVNGSGSMALRHTTTGVTTAIASGLSIDDVWDMGSYGQGFFVAMTAKAQYGNLSYATDFAFSPIVDTYGTGHNLSLAFRDVQNARDEGHANSITETYIANTQMMSLQSANVSVAHSSWGSLTMGLGATMSGTASDVNYSKQGSELGRDFATVHYAEATGANTHGYTPLYMMSMPKGQDKAFRVEYKMPSMVNGLEMAASYAPVTTLAATQSVLAKSMGMGATYQTQMDIAKVKFGVSAANNIGLNNANLTSGTDAGGVNHLAGQTARVRSGTTMGVSAAVAAQGFDASLAYQSWKPYNDRLNDLGVAAADYQDANGLVLRAGYSMNLTAMGATHFGVRYANVKNALQTAGAATNASKASVMDLGVTQAIGNAELYAAYTSFDKPTGTVEHTIRRHHAHTLGQEILALKKMSGFVAGMQYSW